MKLLMHPTFIVAIFLLLAACGDDTDDSNSNAGNTSANTSTNSSTNNANSTSNANTNNNTSSSNSGNNSNEPCDYEAVDGVVTIEAENLPLNEDWLVGSEVSGFQGSGYVFWAGNSHNNDPTHGVMQIKVRITEPGRYQLQWRGRIGFGTNTTEHNDAWLRFPDADDYYGLKGDEGAEVRRYAKPICEDAEAMATIVDQPDVEVADCAEGSTVEGWLKVYGAGRDWQWAGKTSDNDASTVTAEFSNPGVYTVEMAARADLFLLDTVVFHLESVSERDARELSETACE